MPKHQKPTARRIRPDAKELILEGIAQGVMLRDILAAKNMPRLHEVLRAGDTDPEFAKQLLAARHAGADILAEDAIAIADGRIPSDDDPVKAADRVARDRLRVDARFKAIAKLLPGMASLTESASGGGFSITIQPVQPTDIKPDDQS